MREVYGIWLPDGDEHFEFHFQQNEKVDGAGTYQKKKIDATIAACPINRRRLAVDVGAHVGLWSRLLARAFTNVVAFEPVPALAECFALNLAGVSNVRLEKFALSSSPADALGMKVAVDNSGNCSIIDGDEQSDLQVEARRLDDFSLKRVDLIKIDVEGWELEVVRGAERTIKGYKPVVVVEQKHSGRYGFDRDAAVKLLCRWGMDIAWVRAGDYCLRFSK